PPIPYTTRFRSLVKGGGVVQKAEAGTALDDNLGGLAVMRQYPAFRLEAGREDHRQRFRMMRARHRDMRAGFAIRRSDIEEHVKGAARLDIVMEIDGLPVLAAQVVGQIGYRAPV